MPAPELRLVFTPDGAATVEAAVVRTERAAAKAQAEVARSAAAGEAATNKVAGGARQASFALETMARTGQTAGEPMRQLLTIGGEMAFMFGPAGAIAGAIAVLGLTITTLFSRARDDAKKAQDDMLRDWNTFQRSMRDADLGTAARTAQDLYQGDPGFAIANGAGGRRTLAASDLINLPLEDVRTLDAAIIGIERLRRATQLLTAAGVDPSADRFAVVLEKLREATEKYDAALTRLNTTMADTVGGQKRELAKNRETETEEGPDFVLYSYKDLTRWWEQQLGTKGEDADTILARQFDLSKLRDTLTVDTTVDVGAVLANIKAATDQLKAALEEEAKRLREESRRVGAVVLGGLADGIATAVRTMDLGAGFKQMTAGILAGIGGMMIETGQAMVTFGTLIETFKKSLLSFFGGNAVLAGLALVASGAVLQGLSGRIGNVGSRVATGGDRAVGGGLGIPGTASIPVSLSRASSATTPAAVPAAREAVTNYVTVIGEDDPRAQRTLVRLLTNAARRGYMVPA
jgi:hypothetical protein